MRKITILGHELQFKVIDSIDESIKTNFYYGTKKVKYKKYLLFGPVIESEEPKYLFHVYYDITSSDYTKEKMKQKLEKDFTLLGKRKIEVINNDII